MSIINQRYNTEIFTGKIITALKDKQNVCHELQDLKARDVIDSQQTLLEQLVQAVNVTYAQQLQSINADVLLQNQSISNLNKLSENKLNELSFTQMLIDDQNIIATNEEYDVQYVGVFYKSSYFESYCSRIENIPAGKNRVFIGWNYVDNKFRIITTYKVSDTVLAQSWRKLETSYGSSSGGSWRKITVSRNSGIYSASVGSWKNSYSEAIPELTSEMVDSMHTYYTNAVVQSNINKADAIKFNTIKSPYVYAGSFENQDNAVDWCSNYYNLSTIQKQTIIFYLPTYQEFLTIIHIPKSETEFIQYFINKGHIWYRTGSVTVSGNVTRINFPNTVRSTFIYYSWEGGNDGISQSINGFDMNLFNVKMPTLGLLDNGSNSALVISNYPFIPSNWGQWSFNINSILSKSTNFVSTQQRLAQIESNFALSTDLQALAERVSALETGITGGNSSVTYTYTFYSTENGGENYASGTAASGATITMPGGPSAPEGYVFLCWDEKTQSGTHIANCSAGSSVILTEDGLCFYPVWTPDAEIEIED